MLKQKRPKSFGDLDERGDDDERRSTASQTLGFTHKLLSNFGHDNYIIVNESTTGTELKILIQCQGVDPLKNYLHLRYYVCRLRVSSSMK